MTEGMHNTNQTPIGATLRLLAQTEQAEATGTIQIQRLLAWYYATETASRQQTAGADELREAA
jgi:hypothetical protein